MAGVEPAQTRRGWRRVVRAGAGAPPGRGGTVRRHRRLRRVGTRMRGSAQGAQTPRTGEPPGGGGVAECRPRDGTGGLADRKGEGRPPPQAAGFSAGTGEPVPEWKEQRFRVSKRWWLAEFGDKSQISCENGDEAVRPGVLRPPNGEWAEDGRNGRRRSAPGEGHGVGARAEPFGRLRASPSDGSAQVHCGVTRRRRKRRVAAPIGTASCAVIGPVPGVYVRPGTADQVTRSVLDSSV